ncbi:MAG: signal peptidase II [Bacteroidetes bacterium MedPE-SWsnd-G2]|nr:MAG: signal peptidase II [Bacteroidetes bacterium MedPE-SWsnd-G2]
MKLSRTANISLLIILNIAADQITKVIVRQTIVPNDVISIIGDAFILTNVENSGAFLGMGSDLGPVAKFFGLLLLPTLVLAYLVYYILKNKALDKASLFAFCCIAGGGIANVFDRYMYGSVTDFLYIDLGGIFRTGIFNVADISVTAGMLILFYGMFFNKKPKPETTA